MITFFKNPCNLYITLLLLYSSQGSIINTGGTIISQILMAIIVLVGLYYTIKTILLPDKPAYFVGLNILMAMFVIYGAELIISGHQFHIRASLVDNEVTSYNYLKSIFLSLPNIYTFYYFTEKGYLTESLLKKWVWVLFGFAIFKFVDFQITTLNTLRSMKGDVEETTNNMGYLFVALIPSIVIFKNNTKLQYILLSVCFFFMLLGMKRGAILSGALSIIVFLIYNIKNNAERSRIVILFYLMTALIVGYELVLYFLRTSSYFVARINDTLEGNTSSRNIIFEKFYKHFTSEEDDLKFFFGNGANATLDIGINYAHNDWLEIAINQGVLGLCIYALYWILFVKTIWNARIHSEAVTVFSIIFVSYFVMTFFSMSYLGYTLTSSIVFSYYLSSYRYEEYLEDDTCEYVD